MLLLDDGTATDASPGGRAPTVVYSASDLTIAATCEFALLRGLDAKLGRIPPLELPQDAMLDRLAELGDRHERQVLAALRRRYGPYDPATGRGVVEITRPGRADARDPAVLAAKRDETLAALRAGADVVFQAGFFDGRFGGWADFVVRADDDVLHPAASAPPDDAPPDDAPPGAASLAPTGPPAAWSVHDTKLARRAKVTALLQLAAYADQLLAHGIPLAGDVHLVLGDRTVTAHRLADLLPAYRERRARLEEIIDAHVADDAPVAFGDERFHACLRCDVCAPEVEAHRDVLLVAGMRVAQRARLREAGIATIDALAASTGEIPTIAPSNLASLRTQARLQVAQERGDPGVATSGGVAYELVAPDAVGHLPPPDPGDVFFDFEGDPLWVDEAGTWGLEYLFGVLEAPTAPGAEPVFRPFWAHDRAGERQALLDFLAYLRERRAAHPGMHVYHYASYEKTALLRLAGRYGVGEDEVDALLREGVLVDLYATVRAALRVGQRSYSLKKLEPLYMPDARTGEVQTAGESVVEYAEACEVRDQGRLGEWQERLDRIADYNRYDCESTLRLRDWLVARAAEAGVAPGSRRRGPGGAGAAAEGAAGAEAAVGAEAGVADEGAPSGEGETPGDAEPPDEDAEEDALVAALLAAAGAGTDAPPDATTRDADRQALAMLAAAVGYHEREAKPFWWAHFDRLVSHPAEWLDRRSTLLVERADVVADWHLPARARTLHRHLRLVGRLEPGSGITEGANVVALYDPPLPACLATSADGTRGWTDKVRVLSVTAEGVGDAARDVVVVAERLGRGLGPADAHDAVPMALGPGIPPRTDSLRAAIRALAARVAAAVAAGEPLPDHPAVDLLRRRPPRTRSGGLPAAPDGLGGDVATITAAVADLDGSYLAVQGPPGTGKTYTGARVIAGLVARGWRVAVVAQSHTVVENMLREVAAAGVPRERIGKRPGDGADPGAPWTWLGANGFAAFHAAAGADGAGYVLGGTAWDLTHPARLPERPFDLLVVDEAGQYSLADTIAVSDAARNLLLLGDPQQLPQVTQGRHPEPVDRSALGWLTDGHDTLPDELGYFLARTWRMHPALADVVSRLAYEGRLAAVPAAAARRLEGVPPGVGHVLVAHEGNAVASVEEAAEVVRQVRDVLGRTWVDPSGGAAAAAGRPLGQADVVVVAPYNAQVWTIRRALDDAGLPDVRVGTVDLFQGQQAVVVVVSMTASSPADVPRGMEFLLSRNRVNVAISRAQWRAVVVRSPLLTDYLPARPDGLAELGAFLGVTHAAGAGSAGADEAPG
jgi:uncharacterized protein